MRLYKVSVKQLNELVKKCVLYVGSLFLFFFELIKTCEESPSRLIIKIC